MKKKGMSVVLRLLMIISVLALALGFNILPAFSDVGDVVTETVFPNPPSQLLNTGGFTELIWWEVIFFGTPVWEYHLIIDPHGNVVDTHHWNISGNFSSPIYNPEDSNLTAHPTYGLSADADGAHHNSGDSAFAHHWDVPVGAEPGVYTSVIEYFSVSSLNGGLPNTDTNSSIGNWAQMAQQRFNIVQPLSIMKYRDDDRSGNFTAGEPGLENWHFDVTGPGWVYAGSVSGNTTPSTTGFTGKDLTPEFPAAGELFIKHPADLTYTDAGPYTATNFDTVANTADFTCSIIPAPSIGDLIKTSFTTFSKDTDSGGLIVLPNLQVGGDYTVTETLQSGWLNTDPPGGLPVHKVIHVPGDILSGNISAADPVVFFGNIPNAPDTFLTMSAIPDSFEPGGGTTTLTIHEQNTGNVPLHDVSIHVTSNAAAPYNDFTLNKDSGNGGGTPLGTTFSGDDVVLGVLDNNPIDPLNGETWTWTVPIPITDSTHFQAIGTGKDPSDVTITYNLQLHPHELATADVTVTPPHKTPASSTWGMWLLIAVLGGALTFFIYRRTRRA